MDAESDPAFRIINLMAGSMTYCGSEDIDYFTAACLRNLVRLFNEKKTSPNAVDGWNQGLMHFVASLVRLQSFAVIC